MHKNTFNLGKQFDNGLADLTSLTIEENEDVESLRVSILLKDDYISNILVLKCPVPEWGHVITFEFDNIQYTVPPAVVDKMYFVDEHKFVKRRYFSGLGGRAHKRAGPGQQVTSSDEKSYATKETDSPDSVNDAEWIEYNSGDQGHIQTYTTKSEQPGFGRSELPTRSAAAEGKQPVYFIRLFKGIEKMGGTVPYDVDKHHGFKGTMFHYFETFVMSSYLDISTRGCRGTFSWLKENAKNVGLDSFNLRKELVCDPRIQFLFNAVPGQLQLAYLVYCYAYQVSVHYSDEGKAAGFLTGAIQTSLGPDTVHGILLKNLKVPFAVPNRTFSNNKTILVRQFIEHLPDLEEE